ncbi:hypothetical protein AS156_15110 [Bradyrhizobium macuxiense]|uniref:Uncharacterized protein n=1 Tax=Bradyrhizobium macuxiense TaxID=1755647 RepID=A0A109JIZ6_9BRAD|nr:hypothetical protein AS156_15110 [Bradyrhizobium macuxiense]
MRQGAAGIAYFKTGGVSFWNYKHGRHERWRVVTIQVKRDIRLSTDMLIIVASTAIVAIGVVIWWI